MKQKLFVGWVAALMMFGLCSCSNEKEEELEEMVAMTRSQVISPMDWAATMEGTYMNIPYGPYYPEIVSYLQGNKPLLYYVEANWETGFSEPPEPQPDADIYYMQIQWAAGDRDYPWKLTWNNISTPLGNGLVRIWIDGSISRIPAYTFPHSYYVGDLLAIRTRTIHQDFINSSPVPGASYQNMYDRSLFSPWSSGEMFSDGTSYVNLHGFNKPLTVLGECDEDDLNCIDTDANFIVKVILPDDPDLLYSCKSIYNHSGGYTEEVKNKLYNEFIVKGVGTRISYSGELEIEITCVDKNIPRRGGNFSFTVPYSFNDNILEIIADEYNN